MKREEAIGIVKKYLPEKRLQHTLRVADTAALLADKYFADKEKAVLAAIFHDYCKYRPLEEMKRCIIESDLPKDLLEYHPELWHGPVAAVLIAREHGIQDREIRLAIQYHTTGRAHMSLLEMIVFLADYIEPGRNFPGVEEVRAMAEKDIIQACYQASKNTIQHLMRKGEPIYPDTFYAYNDLTKRLNGGSVFGRK